MKGTAVGCPAAALIVCVGPDPEITAVEGNERAEVAVEAGEVAVLIAVLALTPPPPLLLPSLMESADNKAGLPLPNPFVPASDLNCDCNSQALNTSSTTGAMIALLQSEKSNRVNLLGK